MAATNAYLLFKHFHPLCTRAEFFRMLATEMFNTAKAQRLHTGTSRTRALATTVASDDDVVSVSSIGSFQSSGPSVQPENSAISPCVPGAFKKATLRRPCFVCKSSGIFTQGAARKNNLVPRRISPRSHTGCITHNVALCERTDCWAVYHRDYTNLRDDKCTGQWATASKR